MSDQISPDVLPCGHPAACGDPCGWCAEKRALKKTTWKLSNRDAERNALLAERDKLAAELAAAREYQCGIQALVLRCEEAAGQIFTGVDDADRLSQIFQWAFFGRHNKIAELAAARERIKELEGQLEYWRELRGRV